MMGYYFKLHAKRWIALFVYIVVGVLFNVACSDSPGEIADKRANDPWIFIDGRKLVTSANGDSGGDVYERRYYDKENKQCVRLVSQWKKGGLQVIPCPPSFTPPE